ncbi:MAG: S24/S26 family peptidase [Patescibacteria group bacterium]
MFDFLNKDKSLKTHFENPVTRKINHWIFLQFVIVLCVIVGLALLGLNTYYHLKADSNGEDVDLSYEVVKSLHDFVGNIQNRKLVIIQGDIMEPIFYDGQQACLDNSIKSFDLSDIIIYQGSSEKQIFIRKVIALPNSEVKIEDKILELGSEEYFVEVNNQDTTSEFKQARVSKSNILGKIIYDIDSTMGSVRCLGKS